MACIRLGIASRSDATCCTVSGTTGSMGGGESTMRWAGERPISWSRTADAKIAAHEAHNTPNRFGCPPAVQIGGEGLHVAVAHLDEAHLTEP
jgi:hypothetical protein